jgi:phage protein D
MLTNNILKPSVKLTIEERYTITVEQNNSNADVFDRIYNIESDKIDIEYNNEGNNTSTLRLIVRSSPNIFNNEWIPKPLQYIKCQFYYVGDSVTLNAGNFQIESVRERIGNAYDTLEIRAISVPIIGRMYEKKNLSFNNVSLEVLLRDKALGLNLSPKIQVPELFINANQVEQSDLDFLRTLAEQWGFNFTIDNGSLVMAGDAYFRTVPAILTMSRSEYKSLDLEHTGYNTYASCDVSYNWLGENKTLNVKDWGVFTDNLISLRSSRRLDHEMKFPVVSPYHAAYAGLEKLIRVNNGQIKGTLTAIGRPELVALNNIEILGNRFNGKYQIESAVHRFNTSDGWRCECKIRWLPKRAGPVQFTWYDMLEIARGSIVGFGIDIPGIPGI